MSAVIPSPSSKHDSGRKFVVSRRALLEEEQKARAAEVRQTIAPGAVMTGRVVAVRDFGAFVDLGGGVQGLLHISELGWSRVADASHVVTPGQEITVKVLRVDGNTQQIALGLKQLTADPWSAVQTNYEAGQVRQGRVTRIAEFGAFVELEAGIEALAHASTFAPTGKAGSWSRSIAVGTTGAFEVLSVDPEKKRIGVAMVEEGSSRASAAEEAAEVRLYTEREGDTESQQSLGSLADKLRACSAGVRRPDGYVTSR
jgi:small subunit ribosomal protein S1